MLDHDVKSRGGDEAQERRKVVIRVAVAAGLIVTLLATLLILEQQKETSEPSAMPVVSKPDIGVAVTSSASGLSEEVQEAIKGAPDTAQAELASMSAPRAEDPGPLPAAAPVVPEGSLDPSVKPILGAPAPAPAPIRPAPRTGKPVNGDRLFVEAPRAAAAPAPASVSPAPVATPAAPLANGNFVVQLGVFNSVSNAEDLRSKLKQAGIPSQLETRVQVGPFASKEEAVKAQEKLRTLGLGNGMLVAAKKP
ncbi:SPOR domain-containing protein [Uliginosibacterium sp. 31-16]|uniref:SPOR domain-containing protein n=1 Tax=Uliginosibacterium sp. 31-16 TaxID=3068315 RepID=UPI00273D98C5|nr:SPOR domain-containing protein [Uliginosibacterium sp. 31-16]MDP5241065.1 SPOR domain-containing protein [Uliginosibacterium sp. 31-16]